MKAIVNDKNGIRYVLEFENNDVFIGTIGVFSDRASQLLVHKMMDGILSPRGYVKDLILDGYLVTGVGFERNVSDDDILYHIRNYKKNK